MKKLTRIGVILLVVGMSLLLITIIRGSKPYGPFITETDNLPASEETILNEYLWSPREIRIDINANSIVDLYILDENEIRSWALDEIVDSTWSFLNVSKEIFTIQINNRGSYSILVYNPSTTTTPISISMTLFGYERDLLWSSIFLLISGLVTIIVSIIFGAKSKS